MRRPKLPAQTYLRCLRPHQGFNGGTYEHTPFAGHVSGARGVTNSCLSSTQRRATRQRKPTPRSMLHNDTLGPRQLSMVVSPSSGRSSRGKSLTGNFCWKWGHSRIETEAGPVRRLHPSTPGFARSSVPPPLDRRRYHAKHDRLSYKYLRDSLVQSPPSSDGVSLANDSTVATPQAEAGTRQPRRKNHRSKTLLDEDVTSNPQRVDPVGRGRIVRKDGDRIVRKDGDKTIRSLLTRLQRADISKAKFNDLDKLSGDAVIIFLPRNWPNDGHVSDIFETASELFSQEQLVEVTFPGVTPPWTPPEVDKIRLEGEENAAVPVFDSCDEVRAKIDSYTSQPDGPDPWQFSRFLSEQLKATTSKTIDTVQFERFMVHEGPFAGARGVVYYMAYVFFEKLRIAEGRPKSNHRLQMERLYPRGMQGRKHKS